MGIWSVDSVQNKAGRDQRRTLYRLVHYKDDIESTVGVRYFVSPITERVQLGWGEAYVLTRPQEEEPEREDGTILLEHPEDLERVRETEQQLRVQGGEYLAAAKERRGKEWDSPNASPVAEETREPKPPGSGKGDIWARIHVHNVGQGDTLVLELPENQLWLVDARLWGKPRRKRFKEWMSTTFKGRKSFDKVIVTHLHYDHIHSIPFILNEYDVDEVIVPDSLNHTTSSARQVLHLAGKRLQCAAGGRRFRLGELDVQFVQTSDLAQHQSTIVPSRDPNDHEIAIVMQTKRSAAFLAGDIPADLCETIAKQISPANTLKKPYRFYKVSHHGSRTGYSPGFYAAYKSNDPIISCAAWNRYQHPHDPPVRFLRDCRVTWRDGREVYPYSLR